MDRRKFFGTAATATLGGIPLVAMSRVDAQTLGIPASINGGTLPVPKDGLLAIPINDSFIPPALRDVTKSIMTLFANVISNPAIARELTVNPIGILEQYGLSKYVNIDDPLLEMVRMSSDVDLNVFMKNADYASFMAQLKSKGYLKRISKSKLRQHYFAILSKDQESFVKYLKSIFDNNSVQINENHAQTQRLNRIVDLIQDGNGKKPLEGLLTMNAVAPTPEYAVIPVVSVAYIIVVAVTYVIAASQVGVVLNVGAVATAVTKIAVWGVEPEPLQYSGGTTSQSTVQESIRNMQRASIAATLHGRKDLAIEAVKSTIDQEMDAMLRAAEQIGIIKFPASKRKQIVNEIKNLCRDAIAIGV